MEGSQRKTIPDIIETNGIYESHEIIHRSWILKNPEFTIDLSNQNLTTIKFETYMNNAKCQGWPTVSKVFENGQLIEKTENQFYLLGLK